MANALITTSLITKRALVEFKNAMVMLSKVDRQLDKEFSRKVGSSVDVRKRVRYSAVNGPDITGAIEDSVEGLVKVTLDQHKTVAMSFEMSELALDIEEFADRYIKPAILELVQNVESAIADTYKEIYNFTGIPGTPPSTVLSVADANAYLSELGVAQPRYAFYTPLSIARLADALKGLFPNQIATMAIESAKVGKLGGFELFESQSLKSHTVGAHGGTPLIAGAAQDVTYLDSKNVYTQPLLTDGWTATVVGLLLEGDTFTIAGVNSVNPKTREDTGRLQSFVVRANADSDGGGAATLTISPAIIASGSYQTVANAPADNAVITVTTGTPGVSYHQNMAFHRDAITVAFAKLQEIGPGVNSTHQDMDNVSIMVSNSGDIISGSNIWRFDILYGLLAQNPGMAIRHTG